jgi:ligand-binding sensor domain-containing protein/DNA-binding CsgD family transcriptional regulator
MYRFVLSLYALLCFEFLSAQNTIGLPEIVNYTKQVYKGGAQTRQVAQDKNGIMYFANDEGVLTFNGARWNIFPLPNKSLVRCLEFGPGNKLYVGGQDELGYFSSSATGNLEYHSLKNLIPKEARSFADVWEICADEKTVFFQTSKHIYQLTGQQIKLYENPHWLYMGKVRDQLIAQSSAEGMLKFKQDRWVPYFDHPTILPRDFIATSLTSIGRDSILLTTLKTGIYLVSNNDIQKLSSPLLQQLESKNISSSGMVNENQVAIGTNLDGCFIIDKKGNLIRSFGKEEGLQNNSILSIFLDNQNSLWLGLHNGIDFISYNNAVKHIHPNYINEGAGFSSHIYQNQLYIGTSSGVFKVPIGEEKQLGNIRAYFKPIPNTEGEAWNLSEVNGKLLVGHNDGALLLQGDHPINLDKMTGYWNFQALSNAPTPMMVAGTYNGIEFFHTTNNGFTKAPGEANSESARFVVVHNNRVWFSHPYKGVYAVIVKDTTSTIKKYSGNEGLPSNNNNYLFKIKNKLILTTEKGVFEYDDAADRFTLSSFYNKYLPAVPIRYLKEDTQGNVWFVFEKKIGVLDVSTKSPQIIYFPELTNKFVAGFEHINPIDRNNILIGGEKGFYHINYDEYKRLKYPLKVQISSVTSINQHDSLQFGGYGANINELKLPGGDAAKFSHDFNSFHFEFASSMYGQLSNIEYSYYLKGFDANWIDFNKRTEKDYTNLPPGKYVFKVKARNNLGNESAVSEYAFTVLPPWYQTSVAYFFYLLAVGFGAWFLYRFAQKKFRAQRFRYEEEQRKMLYLHQLEIDKAEKELIQLRNEKLEAELLNKNTELASTAMHLVQKSDVLSKIKEQMIRLKNTPATVDNAPDLKKILKTLNEENKMEEQWQQFSLHFDKVHSDFLVNLKTKYPTLTNSEMKLCAYLRMNLSTKEMAQLMNISVRGVEISRYRLRKKLAIPTEANLFDFLLQATT